MSDVPRWAFNAHVDQRDKEIERLNHDYTELQLAYNNLPKLLQEKFEVEIARLNGELEQAKQAHSDCWAISVRDNQRAESAEARVKEEQENALAWQKQIEGYEQMLGLENQHSIGSGVGQAIRSLQDRVKELEGQLKGRDQANSVRQGVIDLLQFQLTAIIQAGEQMVKQHHDTCGATLSKYGNYPCRCGRDALAAAIELARGKA